MYKCKVCNKEFELQRKDHYIARDNGKTGLSALAGGSEEELYDTFDCPHCGCQNIMQERKRSYMNIEVVDVEEYVTASDFEKDEENGDATVAVEKVYADMHAAECSKCFGQYEGTVDCVTCDKEEECLAETEHSQNTNDSNVDVAADEVEEVVPRRCRKKKITRAIPHASSVIGPGVTVNEDDMDWDE